MKIVIESGATKSDWRILGQDGFFGPGINVSAMDISSVKTVLGDGLEKVRTLSGGTALEGFYLYCAGVVSDPIRSTLTEFIRSKVDVGDIDIQDDLVGASRSLFGKSRGIAAILGTGSNTCFYDGKDVHRKVYSGGYVLGDEGSGATLGRLFIADYIKGLIPADVAADFESKFPSSYGEIVERVYHSDSPSAFLGSLAPFILSHYDNAGIRNLVDGNFRAFIERSLKQYDVHTYELGVAGGFGCACRDILTRLCGEADIRIARFADKPITGLLEYHK